MKLGEIHLKPLSFKHYETEVEVEAEVGGCWTTFKISISGEGSKPSFREYEKGYHPDDGMDHVESEEHLFLATRILEALRKQ